VDAWKRGNEDGVLLFFSSDLEHVCNEVGLPHFNASQMCCFCEANTSDKPHTDYSDLAEWRRTLRNNRRFMRAIRQPLHPLVGHPWFSMYTFRMDLLHMLDHHGVSSHVVGNVFWHHLREATGVLPGPNIDARLQSLNDEIKAYYQIRGVQNRVPTLKSSNICESEFPELKGGAIKAANTRSLVPFALKLQRRAVDISPTPMSKHMLKAVESLQSAYDIFYNSDYFLARAEVAALSKSLLRLGRNYQRLAVLSTDMGRLAWKQTPKLHYVVAHLATQSELVNPRYVQTYGSEGLVGKICLIYRASQSGPFHATLQTTILAKYRVGMVITFER